MKKILFFISLGIFTVHAFDKCNIILREELSKANTIAIGTFKHAEKFDGLQSQQTYIQQFREILFKGISAVGYTIVDQSDSSKKPDLILNGEFTVMSKLPSCKLHLTGVSPQNCKLVFEINENKMAIYNTYLDGLSNLISDLGHEIVKFFNDLRKESEQVQNEQQPITCSEFQNKKTAFCMLYTNKKRVTANTLNAELQKLFMKKKIDINRIDFNVETAFRSFYEEKYIEGAEISEVPDDIYLIL